MAFPSPSNWFRTTLERALEVSESTPIDFNTATANAWKCALFKTSVSGGSVDFSADTGYDAGQFSAASHEVAASGDYVAAGKEVVLSAVISSGTLYIRAAAATQWTGVTWAAGSAPAGCLITNVLNTTKLSFVALTFGGEFPVTAGSFTVDYSGGSPYNIAAFA